MARSLESYAFQKLSPILADGVPHPLRLAVRLYADGLIMKETRDKAGLQNYSMFERMMFVIGDLEKVIAIRPEVYEKLRKIFEEEPSSQIIAENMSKVLGESTHIIKLASSIHCSSELLIVLLYNTLDF